MKAPDTLVKLKKKELENSQKQLSIYQKENAKLKQKLSQSHATKETFTDLIQKLREIEQSNGNSSKEVSKMKHSQNIRGKILNRSNKNTHEDGEDKNFKVY
jgi:prefoldin subunit 5